MASFFQPPTSGDPVIAACGGANTTASWRQVYCNRAISPDQRLNTPLQSFTLILAVTCISLPLVISLTSRAYYMSEKKRKSKAKGTRKRFRSLRTDDLQSPPSARENGPTIAAQSFHLTDGKSVPQNVKEDAAPDKTLYIFPLPSFADDPTQYPPILTASGTTHQQLAGLLDAGQVSQTSLPVWANFVSNLVRKDKVLTTIVLQVSETNGSDESASLIASLLCEFCRSEVPVLLKFPHDDSALTRDIDFGLVAGVIVENACILRTGERRDYFRAQGLRDIMARAAEERAHRPAFFVGFHDVWSSQPSAAAACRAEKLARHFDAVFEHGPDSSLQKTWLEQNGKVRDFGITDGEGQVSCLDFEALAKVVPDVGFLLKPVPHPEKSELPGPESHSMRPWTGYAASAPSRGNFWQFNADGELISPVGCVPLLNGTTKAQYEAITATQTRLRDLNMLQRFDDAEVGRLVEQLKAFHERSEFSHLVSSLVDGLVQQRVVVFKGLGTGFTLPDNRTEIWGVSSVSSSEKGAVADLLISRRCPTDIGTVLHTWLAHHGVSRVQRYEEEARLEQTSTDTAHVSLPRSMRAAIDRATPSEVLRMLQQLQLARPEHSFKNAIEAHCRGVLIDDTSAAQWNDAHCRQFPAGTVSMCDLLQRRLSELAHIGCQQLPSVDNLVLLNRTMERLVDSSLFSGDSGTLNIIANALLQAYDPSSHHRHPSADASADLLALLFFSALRRAALEDVYCEATDHCPMFAQPDQAAVFAELWVLGSQCELFFGMSPRALGQILYDRHRTFLTENPPRAAEREGSGGGGQLMGMYSKSEPQGNAMAGAGDGDETGGKIGKSTTLQRKPTTLQRKSTTLQRKPTTLQRKPTTLQRKPTTLQRLWKIAQELGAFSIFCVPAAIDVVLLTFLGRGLFMTAFMGGEHLAAACQALLVALLLSAGVAGWVGSVGNYYLCNYAYNSMVYFHVQRLSGGFVLSLLVAAVGAVVVGAKVSVGPAFTFFAYLVLISTYLYLLGIMATMHQRASPLTSGRTVLWRTIPVLCLSPAVSACINGHDLAIYLSVGYGFLVLLIVQYRSLCHEWINWTDNIPVFTADDLVTWYSARLERLERLERTQRTQRRLSDSSSAETLPTASKESPAVVKKLAVDAFRDSVESYRHSLRSRLGGGILAPDPLVRRVEKGLPYVHWLLLKEAHGKEENVSAPFSVPWFAQVSQALKKQQQMTQGLKEHSIGQNVALFLVCLVDRWVSMAMAASSAPSPSVFGHFTSRYAVCLAILYFCAGAMALDAVLQTYWPASYALSDEKLASCEDADAVARKWERSRWRKCVTAFLQLGQRLIFVGGCCTLVVWLLVDDPRMVQLYYAYIVGYSAVLFFQFNRCFTLNVRRHVTSILVSAAIGFTTGCVLHRLLDGSLLFFADVIALNIAAILAALLTCVWVLRKPESISSSDSDPTSDKTKFWVQRRLTESRGCTVASSRGYTAASSKAEWQAIPGVLVSFQDSSPVASKTTELLESAKDRSANHAGCVRWADDVLKSAVELWTEGRIRATVCSASSFSDADLEGFVSFSKYDGGTLHINFGLFGEDELAAASWHTTGAEMVTEIILFHTSRAVLGLSEAQATQAMSFPYAGDFLPRSVQLEIATADIILQHLCFGINVDLEWDHLSSATREVILGRVLDAPVAAATQMLGWAKSTKVDVQASDFNIHLRRRIHAEAGERLKLSNADTLGVSQQVRMPEESHHGLAGPSTKRTKAFRRFGGLLLRFPVNFAKWVGIISGAGSNIERELWYLLSDYPNMRGAAMCLLMLAWKACWRVKNAWIYVMLIYHHKALVHISRLATRGTSRTLYKDSIAAEMRRKTLTGFASRNDQNTLMLDIFEGRLARPAADQAPLATAVYDGQFRLVQRTDEGKKSRSVATYMYANNSKSRLPITKHIADGNVTKHCHYDKRGRVSHGTLAVEGTEYSFRYFYKSTPKGSHEVLKAQFSLAQSPASGSLVVCWGTPLREDVADECNWVPSDRVCRVVREVGEKTYTTTSSYQHRRDPVMATVLHEGEIATAMPEPPCLFGHETLLQQRPTDVSFENDDLLIYHSLSHVKRMATPSTQKQTWAFCLNPASWQHWRRKVVYRRVPTWWLRTELWNHWRKSGSLDAVAACWMDELILRQEPLLRRYWAARGLGQLSAAKAALDMQAEQMVAAIEIETDVSEVCLLPVKCSDLYTMGLGRDANQLTTRPGDCFGDTGDRISVIFNDIGCWPDTPGGVSNCRRDLVNGHSTIRNHVLAESANEHGIPRFQVEKNVQSLKLLPLWGLDGRTPSHGVIDNLVESEVDARIASTHARRDIVGTFVPLLRQFVKGARSRHMSREGMVGCSNALLAMFAYFEHKDYNATWNSREVAAAWAGAWLTEHDDAESDMRNPAGYLELERPSTADLRSTLAIYSSYFFIFSVQTPAACPRVFQSTHHGISSLFGMLLKYRRGASFGIWDHAILWRECCLNISPAQSALPLPVQSMLLAGIGLAMRLAYFHADVVLPCTPVFNPIWEAELGTDSGRLAHRKAFGRKIDAIVNGVSNMDAFQPATDTDADALTETRPTVVMLSNVQFIKDIRTAILAADIIVNTLQLTTYRLLIYGARDREPAYDAAMARLISSCNLTQNVELAGYGDARVALRGASLFVNSSLSEGLPLAIAEAALAGVPIVATAVGATALVLTDPDDGATRYGDIVPPNDAAALARAQLALLAMAGPRWARFADSEVHLPDVLTAHDATWLQARVRDAAPARRRLGLRGREVVLRGFHGKRYLREHEQMYWVQWHLARMRGSWSEQG
ncbi:hypothetical protein B0T26DRAFT_808046 [Lasiosphaeria miniovina]|uniref:DUF3492 domain-containing protein n=1 Tax=Lasiosphaeria miniovina TaxID=1954250 RepID=A0AA40BFA1_9PEZI|nr:uncharacterized protein B0T26DRAFT_808046 [Lasiosphaeria miniovina]KAK0733184.1 hypothetical protein B0T26DRAFT_808046 [Lasiosphaeria miniovina]